MGIRTTFKIIGMLAISISLFACAASVQKGQYDVNEPNFQIAGTYHAISPDGKWILTNDKKSVTLWDTESGREIRTFNAKGIKSAFFSPDGKRIVTDHGKSVKLWDAENGKEILTVNGIKKRMSDSATGIKLIFFSPDGKRFVTYHGNSIKLWDSESGMEIAIVNGIQPLYGLAPAIISLDGKRIISIHNKHQAIKLWDLESGREIKTINYDRTIERLFFSPDSKHFITMVHLKLAEDMKNFTLYDAENGNLLKTLDMKFENAYSTGYPAEVYFSPDGNLLLIMNKTESVFAVSGNWSIKQWDTENNLEIKTVNIGHRPLKITSDMKLGVILNADFSISLLNILSGEKKFTINIGHFNREHPAQVDLSSNEKQIVVRIPEVKKRYTIVKYGNPPVYGWVTDLSYSIRRWDIEKQSELPSIDAGGKLPVFSQDMKYAVTIHGKNDSFNLWDAESGKVLKTFYGHDKAIFSVFFSPCGSKIISTSGNEIKVWRL